MENHGTMMLSNPFSINSSIIAMLLLSTRLNSINSHYNLRVTEKQISKNISGFRFGPKCSF